MNEKSEQEPRFIWRQWDEEFDDTVDMTSWTPEEVAEILNALTSERDEAVRERDELRAKAASAYVASRKEDIKANYYADDEFRETVCEIVNQVPDGHWITLIVESPEAALDSLTTDKAAQG